MQGMPGVGFCLYLDVSGPDPQMPIVTCQRGGRIEIMHENRIWRCLSYYEIRAQNHTRLHLLSSNPALPLDFDCSDAVSWAGKGCKRLVSQVDCGQSVSQKVTPNESLHANRRSSFRQTSVGKSPRTSHAQPCLPIGGR